MKAKEVFEAEKHVGFGKYFRPIVLKPQKFEKRIHGMDRLPSNPIELLGPEFLGPFCAVLQGSNVE